LSQIITPANGKAGDRAASSGMGATDFPSRAFAPVTNFSVDSVSGYVGSKSLGRGTVETLAECPPITAAPQ
jgi:hypothetical protein